MSYNVNAGETSTGIVLSQDDELHVFNGGTAVGTVVNSDGRIYVSSGGIARDTSINSYGWLHVYNGSVSNTVMSGGSTYYESSWMYLEGGAAVDTEITGGVLSISCGGTAVGNTVNSDGRIYVSSGSVEKTEINSSGMVAIYDGGIAIDTTVNGGGTFAVIDACVANDVKVNSAGRIRIFSGGTATDIVVDEYGYMEIAVASNTYVQGFVSGSAFEMKNASMADYAVESAMLEVHSGGTIRNITLKKADIRLGDNGRADNTVLNRRGYMTVDRGGIAVSTAINSGGQLTVYKEGVASGTTVNSCGEICISSGGSAVDTILSGEDSFIKVNSGTVERTHLREYSYMSVEGGVAYDTVVSDCSVLDVYYGSAVNTVLNNSGCIYVGGRADNTVANSGCSILLAEDSIAITVTVNSGADIYLIGDVDVKYLTVKAGGILNGFAFAEDKYFERIKGSSVQLGDNILLDEEILHVLEGGTVNAVEVYGSNSELHVSSGGVACDTVVQSDGCIYIADGGVVSNTVVNGSMSMAAGGLAIDTVLNCYRKQSLYVSESCIMSGTIVNDCGFYIKNGAVASDTVVNSGGRMTVSQGAVADRTAVAAGGSMSVGSGATASNSIISSGGSMRLGVDAVHRGSLQIANGAVVSAVTGAIIDFSLDAVGGDNDYLINNLSLITGKNCQYTITVSAGQANGTYRLAQKADNFNKTVTIGDGSINYGSLAVNDGNLVYKDKTYSLVQNAGNLILYIYEQDLQAPEKPIAIADITGVTNTVVTVTAQFSSDSVWCEFSRDKLNWEEYIGGIEFSENGIVYFRSADAAGNYSEITAYSVQNIDKIPPEKPKVMADVTDITNQNVTVTAEFGDDAVVKEFSYDQESWQIYTNGVEVSENRIVYFRSQDAIGNCSETVAYKVNNIDKSAPGVPENINVAAKDKKTELTWNSVADSGVAGVKGYYVRYGSEQIMTGDGIFTDGNKLLLSELAGGTYYCQIRTLDNAGNLSDWSACLDFYITWIEDLQGTVEHLSWKALDGSSDHIVAISSDDFAHILEFAVAGNQVDLYALPQGSYQWQVKTGQSDQWVSGNDLTASAVPDRPQKINSDNDGNIDIFFARVAGQWSSEYFAQHLGCNRVWEGTQEKVVLTGKNRIDDIFIGSNDENILILTDDANGDSLFVENIYSSYGDRARLSSICEIRAGAGDDVVDMTSSRFVYKGSGVTVYGGDGNDVIWANCGKNILSGDEGNDRIVGGTGDDVIIGGSGDDLLHGGGGNDIFCFGGDWGSDSVEQLAAGSITLWFEDGSEDNWDAVSLTYTDGKNSVTVSGTDNITLNFGGGIEELPQGAFAEAVSSKIYEEKDNAMLA